MDPKSGRVARDRRRPAWNRWKLASCSRPPSSAHPAAGRLSNCRRVDQLRPDHRGLAPPGPVRGRRHREDGRRHRHRGRLQEPGARRRRSGRATRSSPGSISPTARTASCPTWQHGTGVAGLIAVDDPSHPGVAPGADIVALRVFGDDNQGSFNRDRRGPQLGRPEPHRTTTSPPSTCRSPTAATTRPNQFASDGGVGQEITDGRSTSSTPLNIPVVVAAGNSFDGKRRGWASRRSSPARSA